MRLTLHHAIEALEALTGSDEALDDLIALEAERMRAYLEEYPSVGEWREAIHHNIAIGLLWPPASQALH
ncbi:hypothetical protein [Erythrobacter dokdonensis]|uniref:Uncharacterized protein n=1 Tax=Erythrobacter dokdonensis DSW-74 TaxID=1300349 RepID=A0A1A7BK62_9SPHN|nr:hypothetical protein [Erythrobacter dokdonensis]OBV11570.1 hypothetical protein I603_1013 [Erythrobacter dokdonensis DSW-74]